LKVQIHAFLTSKVDKLSASRPGCLTSWGIAFGIRWMVKVSNLCWMLRNAEWSRHRFTGYPPCRAA